MIIWDDMFEMYPDALNMLPRDIIMCTWLYDTMIEKPESHFGYRFKRDIFAVYERLGFDYIAAPRESHPLNVESLFRYAFPYRPLGGLITVWEKGRSFLFEDYPNIAFTGMLWKSGDPEKAESIYFNTCKKILNVRDDSFIHKIIAAKYAGGCTESTSPGEFLHGSRTKYLFERRKISALISEDLSACSSSVKTGTGRFVMEDMILALKRELLQHDLRFYVHYVCDYISGKGTVSLKKLISVKKSLLKAVEKIKKERAGQWKRFRPGILPVNTDSFYDTMHSGIMSWMSVKNLKNDCYSLLKLRYFLPDYHGAHKVVIRIKFSGNKVWKEVFSGTPKPQFNDPEQVPYFTYTHIISGRGIPERIRMETSGYGGIGIVFAEVVAGDDRFIPVKTEGYEGNIENPDAVLIDNTDWCYLGEKDISRYFRFLPGPVEKSCMGLVLKKETPEEI